MSLRDVVLLQKRELEKRLEEPYVERDLRKPTLGNHLIKVVIGPRRAGKSFFAMHVLEELRPFGYVNFDDERLVDLANCDELLAAIDSVWGSPKHLLLDEIQNLPKWELFANRLQRQGYELIVTGSNAHLLSKELATHLTGRHVPITLFPFSFAEYLRARGRQQMTEAETRESLIQYLNEGGLPEPVVKEIDGRQYRATLWDAVLYKDIMRRARIRSVQGMEDLATYLLSNFASEYSLNRLSQVTRCRSVRTVEKYLDLLDEAFLFFSISRFSYKVREQVHSNRKIYCTDNGFVTARGFQTSPNTGRLAENAVGVVLKKRELAGDVQVFFWKSMGQEEVDFVIREGISVKELMQVCWNLDATLTRNREIRALLKASRELECDTLTVVTQDLEGEEEVEWFGFKGRIRFSPLWKWLLGQSMVC